MASVPNVAANGFAMPHEAQLSSDTRRGRENSSNETQSDHLQSAMTSSTRRMASQGALLGLFQDVLGVFQDALGTAMLAMLRTLGGTLNLVAAQARHFIAETLESSGCLLGSGFAAAGHHVVGHNWFIGDACMFSEIQIPLLCLVGGFTLVEDGPGMASISSACRARMLKLV